MHEPRFRLPYGIIPGAVLALCMIVPLLAAIALDGGFGHRHSTSRRSPDASAAPRAFAPRAVTGFFDGKVLVQVYFSRRPPVDDRSVSNAATPSTGQPTAAPNATRPRSGPTSLQVRLENHSPRPLDVDLLGVSTELGIISTGLQRLTLAPGQTLQTGSVLTGRMAAASRLPVKVTLRLGPQEETKLVIVPAPNLARFAP